MLYGYMLDFIPFGTNDGLFNLMMRVAIFFVLTGLCILALSRIAPGFYRSLGIGIPGVRVGQDPSNIESDDTDAAPYVPIRTISRDAHAHTDGGGCGSEGGSCGCGNDGEGCGCGGHEAKAIAPVAATLVGKRVITMRDKISVNN